MSEKFACEDCGSKFDDNAHLKRHQNKQTPCVIKDVSPKDLTNPNRCIYCNKIYTNIGNKNKHQNKCKLKGKKLESKSDIEIRMLKEQIQQMQIDFNEQIKQLTQNKKPEVTNPTGYLYFITEIPFNNKIKIGISKNPAKRLRQLQTGNPNRLVIYHAMESTDYKQLERTLHNICKDARIVGEWFEMTDSELQSIISGI